MPGAELMQKIKWRPLWPLLIPIALLIPVIGAFPYPSDSVEFSDFGVSHYPNALFLQRSLLQGHIPLWSPNILSGYPFAANPLSGLWYPLGWIALLFPLPLGLNLIVVLHLLLGGLGMYKFLDARGSSHYAALFGALAFELLPKSFAHYGAGHITMVYAIMLTPWLLLAEVRSQEQRGSFWLRQPGLCLALIALADIRWVAYSAILWIVSLIVLGSESLAKKLAQVLKHGLISIALASPLLLPLLEYTQRSTRAQLAPDEILALSLPPPNLLGLVSAQVDANREWVVYVGSVVLALAVLAIGLPGKKKAQWLWIGFAITAIIVSLGSAIPGAAQLAKLPGLSLLRVPPRMFVIAAIAMVILAVEALDILLDRKLGQPDLRRVRLSLFALAALQMGLTIGTWVVTTEMPLPFAWSWSMTMAMIAAVLIYLNAPRFPANFLWLILLLLTILDLGALDHSLFSARARERVMAEGAKAAAFLAQQPGRFRVYSPSYSIPQHTAAFYGLDLADGVDPLQLLTYSHFMEEATGVPNAGYSISLPSFAAGDGFPRIANESFMPDAERLALLNVGYVVAAFELNSSGLEYIGKFDEDYVYAVVPTLPRTYVLGSLNNVGQVENESPNRVELEAVGPGRLILSEIMYPGWVASVDGERVEIVTFENLLRSIELPAGAHKIIFQFKPLGVYTGLGLSLMGIAVLFAMWRQDRKLPFSFTPLR